MNPLHCRRRQAAAALRKHLDSLDNNPDDEAWEAKAQALFQKYLGEQSDLYKKIKTLRLTTHLRAGFKDREHGNVRIREDFDHSDKARALLQAAISFIEENGVYKSAKWRDNVTDEGFRWLRAAWFAAGAILGGVVKAYWPF